MAILRKVEQSSFKCVHMTLANISVPAVHWDGQKFSPKEINYRSGGRGGGGCLAGIPFPVSCSVRLLDFYYLKDR